MFTCESGFKPAAIRYVYLFMSMSAFAIFGRELTAFGIVLYFDFNCVFNRIFQSGFNLYELLFLLEEENMQLNARN